MESFAREGKNIKVMGGGGRVPVVYRRPWLSYASCSQNYLRVANSLPFVAWESKCWTTFYKSMSRPESFSPSRFF